MKVSRKTGIWVILSVIIIIGVYFFIQGSELGHKWIKSDELTSQRNIPAIDIVSDDIVCYYPECFWTVYLNEDYPNIMRVYECDGITYEDENIVVDSNGVLISPSWSYNYEKSIEYHDLVTPPGYVGEPILLSIRSLCYDKN